MYILEILNLRKMRPLFYELENTISLYYYAQGITTIKIVAQRSQPLTILMKTLLQLTLKRLQSHIQPLYML